MRKANLPASNNCFQWAGCRDSHGSPRGQGTGWTVPIQQPPLSPPGAHSSALPFQVQQVHSRTSRGACVPSSSCQPQPGAWLLRSLPLASPPPPPACSCKAKCSQGLAGMGALPAPTREVALGLRPPFRSFKARLILFSVFSHLILTNKILTAALQGTGPRDGSPANKTLSIPSSGDALTHKCKGSSEEHLERSARPCPTRSPLKCS